MFPEKITYLPDAEYFEDFSEQKNQLEEYLFFLDSLNETEAREYLELALEGEILAIEGDEDYGLSDEEMFEILRGSEEEIKTKQDAMKERWHPSIKAYDDLTNQYAELSPKVLIDLVKKAKRKPTYKMQPKLVAMFMHNHRQYLQLAAIVEAAALIVNSQTLQNFFEEYSDLFRIQRELASLRIEDKVKDLSKEAQKECRNFCNEGIIMRIAKLIQKEIKEVGNC